MSKIIVTPSSTSYYTPYLVFDAADAGVVAQLLGKAQLYTTDGGSSDGPQYKPAEGGKLEISYLDESNFQPLPASTIAAQKDAAEKQKWWLAEAEKNRKLQENLIALQAQLDELRRATTCTIAEPEAEAPASAGDEVEVE
jgi:hypothetical protein